MTKFMTLKALKLLQKIEICLMSANSILTRLNSMPAFRAGFQNLLNLFKPNTDVMALKQSGLFDASYYLAHNPDVLNAGVDPFEHYAKHGYKEGREPSPFFSGSRYLSENPDVSAAHLNPLLHWLRYGIHENRRFPTATKTEIPQLILRDLCNPFAREQNAELTDENFVISVVTPTYNTPPHFLLELYLTLENQTYTNWQWVVSDDCSGSVKTIETLRALAARDPRVVIVHHRRNSGISGATNDAIEAATGTHVALVDHDDLLARDAFAAIWKSWREARETDLFYTDECKLAEDGTIYDISLKSGHSPALIENTMYIGHLSVYRRDFITEIGAFRSKFDGTQDYDLALRAFATTSHIRHVDCVGYIWRAVAGSTALSLDEKSYAVERQMGALKEYARVRHPEASVKPGFSAGYWRIEYPLPSPAPLVSCVIPTAGGRRMVRGQSIDLLLNCIESFEKQQFYRNCEFVVVHNGDLSADQQAFLAKRSNIVLVEYKGKSLNLAQKINMGVEAAHGDYVCLLNDDIEAISHAGGDEMVSYLAANPQVGAIAPLCLYEGGTVQHNGVIMLEQGPSHYAIGKPPSFGGNGNVLHCRRDALGVSGALLVSRKSVYQSVGGFSEFLPLNYNDVDYCLKLRAAGLSSIVDPAVSVYHYESASKIGTFKCEKETLVAIHGNLEDPYYNKRFVPSNPYFEIRGFGPKHVDLSHPIAFERWLDGRIHDRIKTMTVKDGPKLSVVVSVYNQSRHLLNEMLKSCLMQTYDNKELVIVDNGSTNPETVKWVKEVEATQPVRVLRHEKNLGINGANRALLKAATGDFIVPMDADDFLTIDALQVMAHAIVNNRQAKVFYSDEFKSDMQSSKFAPFLKSDFDPVMLMNCCYPTHLMAMERAFLNEIGAYQSDEAAWCHDYDTVTRALAVGVEAVHVPEMLYAWRINPGSTASAATGMKPGTVASQRFVLERTLRSRGISDIISVGFSEVNQASGMWQLNASKPLADVEILDAQALWSQDSKGFIEAMKAVTGKNKGWVAVLFSPKELSALTKLSAPAIFEKKVAAVSGYLADRSGKKLVWTGGSLGSNGVIVDPGIGQPLGSGGYHGQILCQRCVDVLAPADLLVRTDMAAAALKKMTAANAPEDFLIYLTMELNSRKLLAAVVPQLVNQLPADWALPLPVDRSGLLPAAGLAETGWLHPLRQILAPESL